ncbi:hypothetical protein RhiJN_21862 [Ceratobasidium sp. AG-Ba]|nr:hypothetical protein RhiJN_21862 [Ceratobasidium sp. AG-Ba]
MVSTQPDLGTDGSDEGHTMLGGATKAKNKSNPISPTPNPDVPFAISEATAATSEIEVAAECLTMPLLVHTMLESASETEEGSGGYDGCFFNFPNQTSDDGDPDSPDASDSGKWLSFTSTSRADDALGRFYAAHPTVQPEVEHLIQTMEEAAIELSETQSLQPWISFFLGLKLVAERHGPECAGGVFEIFMLNIHNARAAVHLKELEAKLELEKELTARAEERCRASEEKLRLLIESDREDKGGQQSKN